MRIQEVKKISVILFMVGFLAGILYVNLYAKAYIFSMGMFSDYFLTQYSVSELKTEEYIWFVFRVRIIPIALLAVLGCTKFKKTAGGIWLIWTGFSSGLILTAAVLKMNIKGIILCLIGVMPHYICYGAVYIMILLYLFTYPNIRWSKTKTVTLIIFMLVGIISECYVNPVLMDIFISNI